MLSSFALCENATLNQVLQVSGHEVHQHNLLPFKCRNGGVTLDDVRLRMFVNGAMDSRKV
jgi:hypothetical protein